jgi:membrane-associated phospholipid phosphatase
MEFILSKYFKSISIDLIKLLQKDKYVTSTMRYVSILGSDQYRLFSIAIVIVLGTKFQLYLLTFIYSFCCLLVNFFKINIREIRPYWQNDIIEGFDCTYDFGFPTDHLIITIPFSFFVWEVIYDRLDFQNLVNAKYFYMIGNAICILISLSIGFSRFVLGLNYLDQYIQGMLIGFLIWYIFKNFVDLSELKLFLEIKVICNKKTRFSFIFVYNFFYFLFLLNFFLVIKLQNAELDDTSLLKIIQICGKNVFPLQGAFSSLQDSAKYYLFFIIIFYEILCYDDNKTKKLKNWFHINDENINIFYGLCAKYYLTVKDQLENNENIYGSNKIITKINMIEGMNKNLNSNKSDYEFAKFLFIFIVFFVFVFIRQSLYLLNIYAFNDNIISEYYIFQLSTYIIIGILSLKINNKINKYFK